MPPKPRRPARPAQPGATGRRSTRARRLDFDPDPQGLTRAAVIAAHLGPEAVADPAAVADLASVAFLDDLASPTEPTPSHTVRLLRPDDLVALDVYGYDLALRSDSAGVALVPDGDRPRLTVRFPFQHLGEQAFYAIENASTPPTTGTSLPGGPPPPPVPPAGDDPLVPPPINALAARASRLVFAVPADERIEYSVQGFLAAMSRLPLIVAPLATPKISSVIGGFRVGDLELVSNLPGNLSLARLDDVLVLTTTPRSAAVRSMASNGSEAVTVEGVLARARALRGARRRMALEPAIDLTGTVTGPGETITELGGRGVGDLVIAPPERIRPIRQHPRAPRSDETAIEAPYRLIISPSDRGGFSHATTPRAPADDPQRVELWHSRLGVRHVSDAGAVSVNEGADEQRVVRAIWARDKEADPEPSAHDLVPFRMSLDGLDRVILVRESADPAVTRPEPVDVERLYLSSLGAWLDLHGRWDIGPYATQGLPSIISWDHEAPMGRDQFVRVVYPGYFFPFGHKCALVKVTERKIKEAAGPQARLYQRKFLIVGEPTRTYTSRLMPFKEVRLRPLVTPDINDPLKAGTPFVVQGDELFWPVVNGQKFAFTLDCLDQEERKVRLQAPLLFVAAHLGGSAAGRTTIRNAYVDDADQDIAANGQALAFAESSTPGDTAMETVTLRFTGEPGLPGTLRSEPTLQDADLIIPAMRHLAPTAPATTVSYAAPYNTSGFTGTNAQAQVFLALAGVEKIQFGGGTDKAGGFIQPDLPVRGLSRALGAVGDIDDLVNKPPAEKFNPDKFLAGVLPKLFGLFELTDILKVVGLDAAPNFVTEALDAVSGLLADLEALRQAVDRGVARTADDALNAATSKLADQANQAKAQLQAVQAQLSSDVDDLQQAVDDLLNLDAPSSLPDVAAAVEALLTSLAGIVDDLGTVVRETPLPSSTKAELERLVNGLDPVLDAADIAETVSAVAKFVNGIDPEGLSVRAKLEWRPALKNFPDLPDDQALFIVPQDGLLLSVEARASGADGVGFDALAELRSFALNLFPDAPLMRISFDRIAFRASSGRKPEVDVVFRGIEFVGVLHFIETLKELVPFDGFADPPYLDVSTEGVTAGFDVALPGVAVGVFALENISLGADVRVPFLGDAVTVGFYFCTRDKPFRLTVMMIGGGGFVGVRLSPKGMVLLEMALEAGACLSVNLGVASGSVSVMVGVYLRLEGEGGSLTGYFRIRGEVDVLGMISASITLELSLTYDFETGKMVGKASITIEVEVFFFSFSVTVSCERRLAGSNGDPTFAQQIGLEPDGSAPAWSKYCAAFAGE